VNVLLVCRTTFNATALKFASAKTPEQHDAERAALVLENASIFHEVSTNLENKIFLGMREV
jgi:hypothetical protein